MQDAGWQGEVARVFEDALSPAGYTLPADLEVKILNVIVVVLATTFLERFTSGTGASSDCSRFMQ